jgi:hypothetical protein
MRHADPIDWKDDRMIRRVFTVASVLSLLLCIALAALWVRSCSTGDSYFTEHGDRDFTLMSACGVLRLVEHQGVPGTHGRHGLTHGKPYPTSNDPDPGEPGIRSHLRVPGLSWLISNGGRTTTPVGIPPSLLPPPGSTFTFFPSIKVNVSYWLLMTLAAILPALRLVAWRRARRRRGSGCCAACGYDLRASKDRCPECGTMIQPAP